MHIINNQKIWQSEYLNEDFSEMIENMKQGDWLLDYMLNRIVSYQEIEPDMNL